MTYWPYLSAPNMIKWGILKRTCKMQFRHVGLRSIGPSSQKLWPNQSFGRSPHCKCKTSKLWPERIYGSIMLNIFVCHFLTKIHPFFTYEGEKLKNVFFWAYLMPKVTPTKRISSEKMLRTQALKCFSGSKAANQATSRVGVVRLLNQSTNPLEVQEVYASRSTIPTTSSG